MQYTWNDNDLIDAYTIAIQLGTKTSVSSGTGTGGVLEHGFLDDMEAKDLVNLSSLNEAKDIDPAAENQIYNTVYFDSTETTSFETGMYAAADEHNYFNNYVYLDEEVEVQKPIKKKKVSFNKVSGQEIGSHESRDQSRWDQQTSSTYYEANGVEDYSHGEGDFYQPNPAVMPDWTTAFPKLTAPPLPSSIPKSQLYKKGDISSLLMSWYMCGYHSGYYDAKQDLKRETSKYSN